MQNRFATGKTVYFGGLPNAQSGTLNPTGYIKRESQRRSGLAQVALARRDSKKQPGSNMAGQATKKALNMSGIFISPTGRLGRLE